MFCSLAAVALVTAHAIADYVEESAKLLATDGAQHDSFGASVAASGDLILVGATGDEDNGTQSGSAYLFDVTTGVQVAKLVADDGAPFDAFGKSVALDGTIAVVGAVDDDDAGVQSGSAYLFDLVTGQQVHKLVASDGTAGGEVGQSVAISGTTVVVGAPGDTQQGVNSGAVYVFDATTGAEIVKLLPNDGAPGNVFGRSVAVAGSIAAVGADSHDGHGLESGSVYLFDVATGQQIAQLAPDDAAPGQRFGRSVALGGGRLVVGAYRDDENGSDSGSAYIFDVSTGQQMAKLLASDGKVNAFFGRSAAVSGTTAIVGADRHDDDVYGWRAGAAYVFDTVTGEQIARLRPSDGAPDDRFATAVAISGTTLVVGADRDDDNGPYSGSVYVLDVPQVGAGYCGPAVPNSSGDSAVIAAMGSTLAANNCVTLVASQVAPNQFGYFLNAQATDFVVPPGSQGQLCLGGGIGRYNDAVQSSGPAGALALELDLANTPTPGGKVALQAGEVWYFQCWFRDKNPNTTSNFTDGVTITFR